MNNNAKSWIAALRSGEYKQGQKWLRGDDKFCCLGVACDLALKTGVNLHVATSYDGVLYSYDGRATALPLSVQGWLGLRSQVGDLLYEGKVSSLAALNDAGKTFNEIAQIIEITPDLFVSDDK